MGLQPPTAPLCPSPGEEERPGGSQKERSSVLSSWKKAYWGIQSLLGLDETGCNSLPWDSLPQGISQPIGSVPPQRAISSDSSSGC